MLMVALVATALTADRLAAAAPVFRPPVTQSARGFAGRLVVSLRRTIPAMRLREFRADEKPPVLVQANDGSGFEPIAHFDFSPFQFRLPPPLI